MPKAPRKRFSQRVADKEKEGVAPRADEASSLRNTVDELKKKLGKEERKNQNLNYKLSSLESELRYSRDDRQYYKNRLDKTEKERAALEKQEKKIKDKMTKDLGKANETINSLKSCKDTRKALAMVTKERKMAKTSRDQMLEAQKLLREGLEETEGNKKPWKFCEICGDEYTDNAAKCPRVLNCGHTVCTSCIKEMLEGDYIRCPFDRQYLTIGKNNVDKLPKNYVLLHM
ncbi:hypothetical protein CAEBREN_06930 [Caenorhabditis brenneri]|uniref:RING-type domain-containing protein n=1 Tax=Caenorhabditis brenneri TaxID=135651 RepID=G0MZ61_CAEBE|nr:hypothetical protein CAEBREN_06930 [Caenorhabditis brenneri]